MFNLPAINFNNIFFVYQSTLICISIGLGIGALEDLAVWPIYSSKGLLSWKVSQHTFPFKREGLVCKIFAFLLQDHIFKSMAIMRLLAAGALLVLSVWNTFSTSLVFILLILNGMTILRSPYGLDGAYQMYLVVLLGLFVGIASGVDTTIGKISCMFIAGELILSYFIAGITKMVSPIWRKSHALIAIFGTKSYGHPGVYKFVTFSAVLTAALSWGVMIFEVGFVGVLFLSPSISWMFVLVGFVFHLFNAIFMGLNDFMLAFPATYPSLFFCLHLLHSNV